MQWVYQGLLMFTAHDLSIRQRATHHAANHVASLSATALQNLGTQRPRVKKQGWEGRPHLLRRNQGLPK